MSQVNMLVGNYLKEIFKKYYSFFCIEFWGDEGAKGWKGGLNSFNLKKRVMNGQIDGDEFISETEIEEWSEEDEIETNEPPESEQPRNYSDSQLRIIRSNLDYNIEYLKSALAESINLSPSFQRRARWDTKKRSLLIESLLINIPIPPIFLFEKKELHRYEVVDGRQRLETIKTFLNDEFRLRGLPIWKELNGKKFSELPTDFKRGLLRRSITATILHAESKSEMEGGIDVRMELFNRLNTGGVQLNDQELRNALFAGNFNNLLFSLSGSPMFKKIWRIPIVPETGSDSEKEKVRKKLNDNALYKTMKDCELVLRFFAVLEVYKNNIKGSMRKLLDTTMETYSKVDEEKAQQMSIQFLSSLSGLYEIFGDNCFINPIGNNRIARNLYDSLMAGFALIENKDSISNPVQIKENLITTLQIESEYEKIITKGNSTEMIKYRIDQAINILTA